MQTNYTQVIEMTEEEKFKMYMRFKKEELVKMLMENQRLLNILVKPPIQQLPTDPYLTFPNTICHDNNDSITHQRFKVTCGYCTEANTGYVNSN